ncbi:MAG: site-2 protease family protein [Holosporaceae bacterium]|jgi:Zn-dependent protease|nr:site-2 protease family protein [Holosporaceae bacterium]
MSDFIYKLVFNIPAFFIAVALHEISHGWAAYYLGDNTAKKAGRLKLHTHFDFWGSFIIPLIFYIYQSPFLIGYAKPVPIDPRNFKDPAADMALVAIAGILCNLSLAVMCAFLLKNIPNIHYLIEQFILNFIIVNLALFFFNLIPIPPLDGSRILAAVIPATILKKYYFLEHYGFFIIVGCEMICQFVSNITKRNISMFDTLIGKPLIATLNFLLS